MKLDIYLKNFTHSRSDFSSEKEFALVNSVEVSVTFVLVEWPLVGGINTIVHSETFLSYSEVPSADVITISGITRSDDEYEA